MDLLSLFSMIIIAITNVIAKLIYYVKHLSCVCMYVCVTMLEGGSMWVQLHLINHTPAHPSICIIIIIVVYLTCHDQGSPTLLHASAWPAPPCITD